jgi:hypothetical protein
MTDALTGVNEKLKRAYENILNLQIEIPGFFQGGKHPIRGDEDFHTIMEAVAYFQKQPIDPRFAVLAGEIIHHFRSCLDHIAWQLSSSEHRRDHPGGIEFPVFHKKPANKDELAQYSRKVKGISNTETLRLIEQMQPYNSPDPLDDPSWIIHDMDRVDKHQELVIIAVGFDLFAPPYLEELARRYASEDIPIPADIALQLQKYIKLSPDIAFRQFGKRENQPVIPSLSYLEETIRGAVGLFAELLN